MLPTREILFYAPLILLVLAVVFMLARNFNRPLLTRLACRVRRLLRRGSWYYLFPAVVLAYKPFYDFILWLETRGLLGADRDNALAAAAAKMVDPTQFYSKTLVAVSNFCLVNALGWGSLLVIPVLVDWATGYYTSQRAALPVVPGFKRTFLELQGRERLAFYVVIWVAELVMASHSLDSGFRMQ